MAINYGKGKNDLDYDLKNVRTLLQTAMHSTVQFLLAKPLLC